MQYIGLFLTSLFITFSVYAQPFQLEEATITSVHAALTAKKITCETLIQQYLDRIQQANLNTDHNTPINAFVNLNPSVLEDARALDAEFIKNKKITTPLHCIPVILKDNIDGIKSTSTSGSFALLGSQPTKDAFLVRQLHQADAIIIGKGTMDEFASGMFGISSRSGRTGNAYDPNQNPGGSSAGPAAAVSANFAVIGIGTDNSGSVRIPAAFNGISGLRPSTGLISSSGIFPRGSLDGVAGPLARTVEDLAIVLDVIAKADDTDKFTHFVPRVKQTYRSALHKEGLKGKRIGVVTRVGEIDTFDGSNQSIQAIFKQAQDQLALQGAVIISDIQLAEFDNNRKYNMSGEVEEVNIYLASFPSTRKDYADICFSNRTQVFGGVKNCLKHVNNNPEIDSKTYKQTLALFEKNKRYVHKVMDDNKLDALFIPLNAQGAASYDISKVNTWRAPVTSNSGIPSIVINAGYSQDTIPLPIGVELVGRQFSEADLIAMAYAYEQSLPARRIPNVKLSQSKTPLDIASYNNFITQIGVNSYEQVLLTGNPKDLTAVKFRSIVQKAK